VVNLTRKKIYLFAKLPLLNLLFALVYFYLAQFGMMWSSLTSNVTLVWPAAGFALFGFLLFGLRIAPGILLGSGSASLLLNIGPHAGFGVTGVACALLMSSADVLQSWLVSRLNRGLLSRNLLISLKPTLYFVGSIFLCCGISSSVGVNTLFRLGIIPEVELAKSWAFWWMGDSIGMLVITSLLSWLLIPRIRNNNTQAQAFLLLCAVVGVVLFSVSALGYIERTNAAPLIRGGDDSRPWYMPSWLQISALALGAMLITLLAAYLRARQKNDELFRQIQQKLEGDVQSHTEALRKANDWLLNEVVQRQQAQEQLQASQAALSEQQQHLRSLLDNIPDPIWFKDLNGVYASCNKAFARMLGKTEEQVIGTSEERLVSPELAEAFRINDQLALKSPGLHRYEQTIHIEGTDNYFLDISKVAVRDEQGNAVGILGIGRDIAAQKKAERDLSIAKETAEEATRAKSRFLANMSHEIRTPLNAVLGYTQLLMRDDHFIGNQRERLELILSSGQRLLGLINDILDLSKIESGVLNLRQDYFDLRQEMVDIGAIMQGRAAAKALQLITQIDLPAPYIVQGDRQKIGQILINLLGNAIKFTPKGSVSLQITPVANNKVEFVIGDTGPGIAEKELAELFAAFRQGQAGEEAGGTGLGLALSRHLAEGMGGRLELSSVLGQGTLAYLTLPLAQQHVALEHHNPKQQVQRLQTDTQCRALVVEDDSASCEILADLLRQIGCETNTARDGQEGLLQCANRRFDIIFTDIRMPGLNGLEMLRKLRTDPAYATTPMIAVSASSLEHERAFYLAEGFQDFIGKPYAFDDICNALRQFAGVSFAGEEVVPSTTGAEVEAAPADITALEPQLLALAKSAAGGDMSNTKKMLADLTPEQLGSQRHQQLLQAVRNYDLERIEKLIHTWLAEA
jgi:two-component system aerobic respiration control sensor histidine kinase ArcB